MIGKLGRDSLGLLVLEGHYAIHPAGHLVVMPPHTQLKDGFRWATKDEVDGKPADEPAPVVIHESVVELTSE